MTQQWMAQVAQATMDLRSASQAANHGLYMGRPVPSVPQPSADFSLSPLEEFKAREAASKVNRQARDAEFTALQLDRVKLLEKIDFCGKQDSRWWPEKAAAQHALAAVDQRLMIIDAAMKADIAQADKFSRLSQAVAALLRNTVGRTVLLSQVQLDKFVSQEWRELVLSRIIRKSTEIKEVLLQRASEFEVYVDSEGRTAVRFPGETGTTTALPIVQTGYAAPFTQHAQQALAPMASPSAPGAVPNFRTFGNQSAVSSQSLVTLSSGVPTASTTTAAGVVAPPPALVNLSPEQLAAVELELLKAGGSDRFRRISLHCGIQEEQLARHFRLYEVQGKQMVSHRCLDLTKLESLLLHLKPLRASIGDAMCFCMDNAQLAGTFARVLVQSLELSDLAADIVIARFFLISDVLVNTNSGVKGSARYRTIFEELLPDACEHLGRVWLPSLSGDRERAEHHLRSVLAAWKSWDVYPSVFIGGLEALLLAPAPDPSSSLESLVGSDNDDPVLRQKLERWCHEVGPAEIRLAARRRGLAGPNLLVAACRLRFCHYERYWHRTSVDMEDEVMSHCEDGFLDTASVDGDPLDAEDDLYRRAEEERLLTSQCRVSLLPDGFHSGEEGTHIISQSALPVSIFAD